MVDNIGRRLIMIKQQHLGYMHAHCTFTVEAVFEGNCIAFRLRACPKHDMCHAMLHHAGCSVNMGTG